MAAKPMTIPSKYSNYATQNNLFNLFQFMLEELLVAKPDDPLTFLQNILKRPTTNAPKIAVYGPPTSGQHSLSSNIARRMRIVHIRLLTLLEAEDNKEMLDDIKLIENLSPIKMAKLISNRLLKDDCRNKGWVIEGYPRTYEQGLALQAEGVLIQHFIHLQAPDEVLLERYSGKRVDPITGDVYHIIFDPPTDKRVLERLMEEEGGIELMCNKLKSYHRHSELLLKLYKSVMKSFCADQPLNDLFLSVSSFLNTCHRSHSPHTPRVILLGPPGAGKSWQANELANKYRLVDVDCRLLLKQGLSSDNALAKQMLPFYERDIPIPDDMVMLLLLKRLSQVDCATRGWILHGFPMSREQAELLANSGHHPYRVIFLNAPIDTLKERLCLRRTDPVTGERYHLMYRIPPTQDVKNRLITHPNDEEKAVDKKVEQYNSYVEELQDYYTEALHINAEQDPYTVYEEIENFIIYPLPKAPLVKNTLLAP